MTPTGSNKLADLVGPLSHDFNNLACAVKLYTQMALKKLSADHPSRIYLTHLEEVSNLMPELTDKILSVLGTEEMVSDAWDLNEVIYDLYDVFELMVGNGVHILLHLGSGAGSVQCQVRELQQIILIFAAYGRDSYNEFERLTFSTSCGSLADLVDEGENSDRAGIYNLISIEYGFTLNSENAEWRGPSEEPCVPHENGTASYWLATGEGLIHKLGGHISLHTTGGMVTGVEIFLPRWNECQTS